MFPFFTYKVVRVIPHVRVLVLCNLHFMLFILGSVILCHTVERVLAGRISSVCYASCLGVYAG